MSTAVKKKKSAVKKNLPKSKKASKVNKGFEKAWMFWKDAQVDLSGFKFNREEAHAR